MGNHPSLQPNQQQQQQQQQQPHHGYPSLSSSTSQPTQNSNNNNNTASSGLNPRRDGTSNGIRHLLRNNGALGLSKAELDARCQPSGLYGTCHWDPKQIRRLIGDGKLAARCKGVEINSESIISKLTECPICFFYYSDLNQTKCCQAYLCTECYLQVRNPKDPATSCPFCCNPKLVVKVAPTLTMEAIKQRKVEEQKVIEAQIRASQQQQAIPAFHINIPPPNDSAAQPQPVPPSPDLSPIPSPRTTAFGASLEQNARVAMLRKRSTSGSAEELGSSSETQLKAMALTPEERQALEAEMKAQHQHPLTQRMQQEEAERRFQNQVAYLNSDQYQQRQMLQQQRLHAASRRLVGRSRDWNRIVQAFEASSNPDSAQETFSSSDIRRHRGNAAAGLGASLDDLLVLEAAIMLANADDETGHFLHDNDDEEEDMGDSDHAGRHRAARRFRSHRNPPSWMMAALLSEEEQLAMAIAASLRDAMPTTTATATTHTDTNNAFHLESMEYEDDNNHEGNNNHDEENYNYDGNNNNNHEENIVIENQNVTDQATLETAEGDVHESLSFETAPEDLSTLPATTTEVPYNNNNNDSVVATTSDATPVEEFDSLAVPSTITEEDGLSSLEPCITMEQKDEISNHPDVNHHKESSPNVANITEVEETRT